MLDTVRFGELLRRRGFDFYSGVPCSFLKDLINYSINEGEYVMAANEGDAAAICAGAYLGGRKPVLLMQNSGLGNAVSPLTSLHAIFRIPVLGFVSLRGEPGLADEPQHELMGPITAPMLETMGIAYCLLADSDAAAEAQLAGAESSFAEGKPFFFIVKKGIFSPVPLGEEKKNPPGRCAPPQPRDLAGRNDMLKALKAAAGPDAVLLATTGFTGRELYELGDGPGSLYMAGSLGCISSLALGLSLARPDKRIIALDGDGSLLMRTGSMAVNAWYKPASLLHVLFDNRAHESTGGQFTVSSGVDWPAAAKAFGYPSVSRAESPAALAESVQAWNRSGGLRFIYAPIRTGAPENLGRPKIKPAEVTERLRDFLRGS
ncbi:MAG: phosphonopyruvate decarboxylase [Spirochaetaceae bacterium]|jgi:phosphonopyruvate decarboxylase|nr:phosphonopyruvate decarboxylase [Spirochaetaceae bacterium]